jgi:hypothetical protein
MTIPDLGFLLDVCRAHERLAAVLMQAPTANQQTRKT